MSRTLQPSVLGNQKQWPCYIMICHTFKNLTGRWSVEMYSSILLNLILFSWQSILRTHKILCILCYKCYCNNTPIILKLQYGNSGCSMIKVASNWVYMTCDEVYSYHLQHFNLLFQLLFAIDSVIAQRLLCVEARFHNSSCQFYFSQFDMLIRPYMVCFFSQ